MYTYYIHRKEGRQLRDSHIKSHGTVSQYERGWKTLTEDCPSEVCQAASWTICTIPVL